MLSDTSWPYPLPLARKLDAAGFISPTAAESA
jgi:hypothetical protein